MNRKNLIFHLYSILPDNREDREAMINRYPALRPERELMLRIEQAISEDNSQEARAPAILKQIVFHKLRSSFIKPWHLLISATLLCIGSVIFLRATRVSSNFLQQENFFLLTFCVYGLLLFLLLLPFTAWLRSNYLTEIQHLMNRFDHYLEHGLTNFKNILHR